MLRPILQQSWRIYRQHFPAILAVVAVVWVPLELLDSYMNEFVFDPEDTRKSWRFAQLLETFFGIIATAGVIFIAREVLSGSRPTFPSALAKGFRAWSRILWARIFSSLLIVGGFLLLIVPGFYMLVRLSFIETVAVLEGVSGSEAMQRSFRLTEGRFWLVFRLGLVLLGVILAPVGLVMLMGFVPFLDHWLITAAAQFACDVVAAFGTIALVTAYTQFKTELATTQPAGS